MAKGTTKKASTISDGPTFKQRMQRIEHEAEQQKQAQIMEMAEREVNKAFLAISTAIREGKDEVLKSLLADYKYAKSLIADGGGMSSSKAPASGGMRRAKRSAEDLKAEADKIFGFISKAKDGATTSALAAYLKGEGMQVNGTVKGFLEKHGHKVKTKGERRSMVYHAE